LADTGELDAAALGPHGSQALRLAVEDAAQRGDEGEARALFEALLPVVAPKERAEIQDHLDAISRWVRDAVAKG
ncbi:hypothetical protein, partial [Klebsiella pneumoniae]|uniref:hypothetical protein n=1 Tax=Klebsiella pneumoniae TaxID=573 RepID=UPI003EDF37CE